jgi:dipeptidase E
MKLLLTSAGIKNPSIHDALVDLRGKPIAEPGGELAAAGDAQRLLLRPPAAWEVDGGSPTTKLALGTR